MISEGTKVPDFRLQNQDGTWRTLNDFAGKWVVLYIYPKDDTPGCTIQGQSFTVSKNDFDKLNTVVLGLSEDDVSSHKNFCDKFAFKIELLADPTKALLGRLGISQSEWKGTMFWDRSTFIIDPKQVVRKVYQKVSPQGHEQVLLNDLRALQRG